MPVSPFHYEPNIISNPFTHFGVWTPEGWRVHTKRWIEAQAHEMYFSGDGTTTLFKGLPPGFNLDGHNKQDLFTDEGIWPSEPRLEYPAGRPRWAVSHTYLAYPFADQTLYIQEYVIDAEAGTLQTAFREHVECEEAVTDSHDGRTVKVKHRPISQVIVGNRMYRQCNSAVRGVWSNADKSGPNYYLRQRRMLLNSLNAVYIPVAHTPVVDCQGIWKVEPDDEAFFDEEGELIDVEGLAAAGVPVEVPAISAIGYFSLYLNCWSERYQADLAILNGEQVTLSRELMAQLAACKNVPFREHAVGYAAWQKWEHEHVEGKPGSYCPTFDFNKNGVVDDTDEALLARHIGQSYRVNYYSGAYFGSDWLSAGTSLNTELLPEPVICFWSQGGGYDAEEGIVFLHETPGPNQKVFVEYHYDRPAEPGVDNIKLTYYLEAR